MFCKCLEPVGCLTGWLCMSFPRMSFSKRTRHTQLFALLRCIPSSPAAPRCHINETLIQQVADALVSSGLRDAGYVYVNIDDCWWVL